MYGLKTTTNYIFKREGDLFIPVHDANLETALNVCRNVLGKRPDFRVITLFKAGGAGLPDYGMTVLYSSPKGVVETVFGDIYYNINKKPMDEGDTDMLCALVAKELSSIMPISKNPAIPTIYVGDDRRILVFKSEGVRYATYAYNKMTPKIFSDELHIISKVLPATMKHVRVFLDDYEKFSRSYQEIENAKIPEGRSELPDHVKQQINIQLTRQMQPVWTSDTNQDVSAFLETIEQITEEAEEQGVSLEELDKQLAEAIDPKKKH